MRVIYWNIEFNSSTEQVLKLMAGFDRRFDGVDYWCLSEANEPLAKLLEAQGMAVFYRPNTSYRGVLIATRHKKTLKKCRAYSLGSIERKGETYRTPLLLAGVEYHGKTLILATTHLTYLRPKEILRRRSERRLLIKYLPRQKTVLGGDLNTVVLPFAKWDVTNLGYRSKVKGNTWRWHRGPNRQKMPLSLQLDHVLATADLTSRVEAKILGQQAVSDHYPILATIN